MHLFDQTTILGLLLDRYKTVFPDILILAGYKSEKIRIISKKTTMAIIFEFFAKKHYAEQRAQYSNIMMNWIVFSRDEW